MNPIPRELRLALAAIVLRDAGIDTNVVEKHLTQLAGHAWDLSVRDRLDREAYRLLRVTNKAMAAPRPRTADYRTIFAERGECRTDTLLKRGWRIANHDGKSKRNGTVLLLGPGIRSEDLTANDVEIGWQFKHPERFLSVMERLTRNY